MTNLKRVVIEVFGGCNYTCKMCPQGSPGRETSFIRKMPLAVFTRILDEIVEDFGTPLINLEGSGEPTMAKDLPKYIQACTDRGLTSYIYSNGTGMHGKYMQECVDAGLGLFRFSVIGYNEETYKKWMNADNFNLIHQYAKEMKEYIKLTGSTCQVHSYHLILNQSQKEYELEQYKNNFINSVGTIGYVWALHNWSGNHNPSYTRNMSKKRTCGRPFADELTIRAGGLNGRIAAVTPCCQVLGPPNESASVLGHLDRSTIKEIYYGDAYNDLRESHKTGNWPSYCQDCDFLYDDPEVLVWTNDTEAKIGKMLGTDAEINN